MSSMVFNWPFFADKYSFIVRTEFAIICLIAFVSFQDKMSSKSQSFSDAYRAMLLSSDDDVVVSDFNLDQRKTPRILDFE
jgi:hypothetical protein